ncbi:NAD kinase [Nonlabens xiamenensis]|uniref:NAD kinase n=1 Tax=Nonlabens xiamenensis TaxID=2341043 RepID=UPI000F6145E5|nr:NAD kinase [Nonlabens xiamenensis]
MQKIAIYGRYLHDDTLPTCRELLYLLLEKGCEVAIENEFHTMLLEQGVGAGIPGFETLDASYDVLISIGGDGTVLRAVSFVGKTDIPVIGVNTGRLGFLATLHKDQLKEAVVALFEGRYQLSKRSLITLSSSHADQHTPPHNFALNEVTVSRMNTTSMIQIETMLNGELLTSYWADGLIVSTPTGSTGYSLSCGGPLISPDTDAFVLTPIAPHNLNARPLVIPDHTKIELRISGREEEFLASLDNRIASYPNETILTLKKADFTIDLIELTDQSFIKTIREKLLWGEDKRN